MERKIEIKYIDEKSEGKISEKDLLNIILEEWKELRAEIKQRVEQRNYMTEIMVALVSALIAAGSATTLTTTTELMTIETFNAIIFGIVPFVTVFFMFIIKASYNRHRLITKYIRDKIENTKTGKLHYVFSEGTPETWIGFDTWFDSEAESKKTNRAQAYTAFNVGTFLVCGSVFSFYVYSIWQPPFEWLRWLFIPYLLVGGVAVYLSRITQADIVNSPHTGVGQHLKECCSTVFSKFKRIKVTFSENKAVIEIGGAQQQAKQPLDPNTKTLQSLSVQKSPPVPKIDQNHQHLVAIKKEERNDEIKIEPVPYSGA